MLLAATLPALTVFALVEAPYSELASTGLTGSLPGSATTANASSRKSLAPGASGAKEAAAAWKEAAPWEAAAAWEAPAE